MKRTPEYEALLNACKPGTTPLKFELEAGFLNRGAVRRAMNSSVKTFTDKGVFAIYAEEKKFFYSIFHFKAINIPKSMIEEVDSWLKRLENLSDEEY